MIAGKDAAFYFRQFLNIILQKFGTTELETNTIANHIFKNDWKMDCYG